MPVYNEEACIAQVMADWLGMLEGVVADFRLIVLNDGSRDGTAAALAPFRADPRVEVIDKPNSGHGPTILIGYRRALELADWVFQVDSDDEMPATHFPRLWERRDGYDLLLGIRAGREQGLGRRLISSVSRASVRLLFGHGVADVNSPYRLMRAAALAEFLPFIPADTFAPNVVLSGLFARRRLRIDQLPVPHRGRRTGTASIVRWRLWKSAARAFVQTLRLALRTRA